VLTPRRAATLAANRAPQILPLILAAVLLAIMQARLLPVRPVPLNLPSTIGTPPGAAPEQAVAPPTPLPATLVTQALPVESEPPTATAPSTAPSSDATAERMPAGPGGAAWSDRLPRVTATSTEGAGNLNNRAKLQPTAVTTLVTSIMKSLQRIHPSAAPSAKELTARLAPLKTPPKRIALTTPTRAFPPKPNLTGWALGGATAPRGILGGPAQLANRYAPTINGATPDRYR
jgi:hypothetical protein